MAPVDPRPAIRHRAASGPRPGKRSGRRVRPWKVHHISNWSKTGRRGPAGAGASVAASAAVALAVSDLVAAEVAGSGASAIRAAGRSDASRDLTLCLSRRPMRTETIQAQDDERGENRMKEQIALPA